MGTAPSALLSSDATGDILLVHTIIVIMSIGVLSMLLRVLLSLRRGGEALPGLLTMLWLILATAILRAAWLGCLWLFGLAPLAVDLFTFLTSFTVLAGIPIIVSSKYLPEERPERKTAPARQQLPRAMVAVALFGFLALLVAIGFRSRKALLLAPATTYVLIAVLLLFRTFQYRHLRIRRRPLLLFAMFMIAGLWLLAGIGIYSVATGVRVRLSLPLALLNGTSLTLILCSVVFLFANIRLADLVVKRALRVVLWTCTALLACLGFLHSDFLRPKLGHAGGEILCFLLVFAAVSFSPTAERGLDKWVDKWLFERPDLGGVIESLWLEMLKLKGDSEVFCMIERFLRDVLRLAAVRVLQLEIEDFDGALHSPCPGPYFVTDSSRFAGILTPPANVVFPLFVEGRSDHVIALNLGEARPPLALWELEFIERVAARLQIWLGIQTAMKRERLEAAFRQELSNAELRALRSQVNPHFLFNSLNTIADLAVIAPVQAEEMTVRLSSVFRYVLVNTDRQYISLEEELDFARSYLHIEQTRFGDRLKVIFDIDPLAMEQQIPTLLLQPLIENALKHGLAPRREGGTLVITAEAAGENMLISIADDGVGLHAHVTSNERSTRVGVKNVSDRLNTSYGDQASLTLRKREQGGTEALIVIPRGPGL